MLAMAATAAFDCLCPLCDWASSLPPHRCPPPPHSEAVQPPKSLLGMWTPCASFSHSRLFFQNPNANKSFLQEEPSFCVLLQSVWSWLLRCPQASGWNLGLEQMYTWPLNGTLFLEYLRKAFRFPWGGKGTLNQRLLVWRCGCMLRWGSGLKFSGIKVDRFP